MKKLKFLGNYYRSAKFKNIDSSEVFMFMWSGDLKVFNPTVEGEHLEIYDSLWSKEEL